MTVQFKFKIFLKKKRENFGWAKETRLEEEDEEEEDSSFFKFFQNQKK